MISARLRLLAVVLFLLPQCSTDPPEGGQTDGSVTEGTDAAPVDGSGSFDALVANPDGSITEGDAGADPNRPGNRERDSDCDGLSDEEEFGTVWASGRRTDPDDADSDGDGLADGLEAGRTNSPDARCTGQITPDGDPTSRTDPTTSDSDRDGLADGAEDANHDGVFGRVQETDPKNPDSDADGLCDGALDVPPVCTGGDPDPRPGGSDSDSDGVPDARDTAPSRADRDGDGLCDGAATVPGTCVSGEDTNGDGTRGPRESDPDLIDTDCDGLVDGAAFGGHRGERDLGTDPTNPDSDGDGLADGVEAGVRAAPDPSCTGFTADADPATTTNPTRADTDGDGLPDGVEDSDQDGARDAGELDPNDPADGTIDPTVREACALATVVPVDRHRAFFPDQQIATARRGADSYAVTSTLTSGGRVIGRMGWNADAAAAFLAITRVPSSTIALTEEQRVRTMLATAGAIQTPITTSFTTWDGYSAAHGSYQLAASGGTKALANTIARAIEAPVQGLLPAAGDVATTGGFSVEVEIVVRSPRVSVVLVAVVPEQRADERGRFALSDLARGSALGQFHDAIGVRCDRFETRPYAPLDVLWSVDNSASMSDEQNAVASAAAAMVARLQNATVDWRVAAVTSGFYDPRGQANGCTNQMCGDTTKHQCRSFTTDLNRFRGWFTSTSTTWLGAGGTCNQAREEIVRSAQLILSNPPNGTISFLPATANPRPLRVRQGAALLLIFMGDADDQFYDNAGATAGISTYEAFFRALPVSSVKMGGILCPDGRICGNETQRTPRVSRELINRFGGVIGSLNDIMSIGPTVNAIVDDAIGGSSPYVLSQSAIPSTIKVALEPMSTIGACNWSDVPRTRTDGFDYDARSRAIQLYGRCRPDPARPGRRMSVSYRYWIDQSPEAEQPSCTACATCPGIARCDLQQCSCVCSQTLSCSQGYRWSAEACDCVCDDASLGCPATHRADSSSCACVCRADCGGCPANTMCNASLCECRPIEL